MITTPAIVSRGLSSRCKRWWCCAFYWFRFGLCLQRELNPRLTMAGVVITMYDDRTRLSKDVERELRQHLPAPVFKTVIPRSVRVAEAPSYGIPVGQHDPNSAGSRAYALLAEEVTALG